ncbi:unnamed protein product [Rhizoctonia solani]|uniref:F-box domain-containing protein n=1 Tax=Rhizoctonia solani TaxID=456999 RepID=A0A8H3HZT3_9AGAM|nr:unnamed protein product [Rhizoctonia solani]
MPSSPNLLDIARALDESTLSWPERRAHNSKQFINKLPDELLGRIFLVTTALSIRTRGAYRFTLFPDVAIEVCSQWMRVALATPDLWTHLHIREHFDDDDIALWVSRAGTKTLLDIEIDILEPYCGVAFFDITNWSKQVFHIARIFKFFQSLKAGPQRWRSLSLSVLQPEPLYKFIQLLNTHPAPNLRYLYLCSEPDWNDDEFNEDRPLTKAHNGKAYTLSEHAVPNLRHAEFVYVAWKYVLDRPKPLLSGLTTLQLSAGSWFPQLLLPSIQRLLLANPNLESLQIGAGSAADYEFDRLPDEERPDRVHLSHLRTLSLEGGDSISLVWDIISIINAPSLKSLTLANNGVDEDDPFVAKIFDYIISGQLPGSKEPAASPDKPPFPLLQELDIDGLFCLSDQSVAALLSSLPVVTRLAVGVSHAKATLDRMPHALPQLETLSLGVIHKDGYQELEDLLHQRAQNGRPIRIVEASAKSHPEPAFQEKFPETLFRVREVAM